MAGWTQKFVKVMTKQAKLCNGALAWNVMQKLVFLLQALNKGKLLNKQKQNKQKQQTNKTTYFLDSESWK